MASPSSANGLASMGVMSTALKPDIDKCVERWQSLLQKSDPPERNHALEINNQVRQVEVLWHHMTSKAAADENDLYLTNAMEVLDSRIEALEAELEATKQRHRLARLRMLRRLREQRQRAVGVEMASSGLMLPAQATSAAAESEANNNMKALALEAVRRRPSAAKAVAESGSCQEGEIRLSLDNRKLIDLLEFDPSETCRVAAASTTAAVRARFEAQRLIWNKAFEDEKQQIEAKIREVNEQEMAEQSRHEALVTSLMARFEAHNKKKEADKARGVAHQNSEDVQGGLRAVILGGAQASSSSASPQKAPPRSVSRTGNGHPDLERLREIAGKPVSEGGKVKQWGATLVAQLGLNFYPSKPEGWGTQNIKSKTMVAPKVARSIEEALTTEPESAQSQFLSRFLLGSERSHGGMSADQISAQMSSAPASATASTMCSPSVASTRTSPSRKI